MQVGHGGLGSACAHQLRTDHAAGQLWLHRARLLESPCGCAGALMRYCLCLSIILYIGLYFSLLLYSEPPYCAIAWRGGYCVLRPHDAGTRPQDGGFARGAQAVAG